MSSLIIPRLKQLRASVYSNISVLVSGLPQTNLPQPITKIYLMLVGAIQSELWAKSNSETCVMCTCTYMDSRVMGLCVWPLHGIFSATGNPLVNKSCDLHVYHMGVYFYQRRDATRRKVNWRIVLWMIWYTHRRRREESVVKTPLGSLFNLLLCRKLKQVKQTNQTAPKDRSKQFISAFLSSALSYRWSRG